MKLSLCFTKGKLIIALDEPTEAIRLFGREPEKRFSIQLTYVTKLFQLNYIWHFSRNPGIDFNVSSDKERERDIYIYKKERNCLYKQLDHKRSEVLPVLTQFTQ